MTRRRTARVIVLLIAVLLLSACGGDERPAYLRDHLPRREVVASLDAGLCGHRMRVIDDAQPYWVGLCDNRSVFEDRVVFLAFGTRAQRDFYLAHLESCFERGRYRRGPQWFAMAVSATDARTLSRAGAGSFRCHD